MNPIGEKLLGIFRGEHQEHSEQIRLLIDRIREAENPGADLEEAFRRAHSLKGAARAVDIGEIEKLGHRLETLFTRVREGVLRLDTAVADVVHQALDCSEDILSNLSGSGTPPGSADVLAAIDRLLTREPQASSGGARPLPPGPAVPSAAPEPVPTPQPETPSLAARAGDGPTVRLRTAQVARLLRTCDQMLSAAPRHESLTRSARTLAHELDGLANEWGHLRTSCAAQWRRLSADPEFIRFNRFLEGFEKRLRQAPGSARRLALEQQRGAAEVRQLTSQLRSDVWKARLIPAGSVFDGFGNMVRSLARSENKQVRFRATGLEAEADREVLQALRDPVMHLLRNAVSHGIESPAEREKAGKPGVGQVNLSFEAAAGRLSLKVSDDGRGIDFAGVAGEARRRGLLTEGAEEAPREETLRQFLFAPGFSTAATVSEIAGRGMGLSAVEKSVRRLQGEIETLSDPGAGATIVIRAPLSVLMQRVLLVSGAGQIFALPLQAVERAARGSAGLLETIANQPFVRWNQQSIRALPLAAALGLPHGPAAYGGPFVIARNGAKRVALFVDELIDEREALVKELNIPGAHSTLAGGGVLLEDGAVALVLNVPDLLRASEGAISSGLPQPESNPPQEVKPRILLADDSITTRALETSILECHGYHVVAAVDGAEALQMLRTQGADLVISDVQMPRLDGFGLLQAMKSDKKLARIPVIMLTSVETPEEQEKGLALGADAYIVKRKFDQGELLDTIRQIL